MKKKRSETEIQRTICEYLKLKGYFFTRTNNTPVFDHKRGAYRALGKYVMRGFPDILVLYQGQCIAIEVKSETGRLSKEQKEFRARFIAAGGAYIVARNVSDLIDKGL